MGIGTATHDSPIQWGWPATRRATCRMAGDAGSVRAVRAVVQDLLAGEPPEVRDVAVLLTDELVTNALVHGGGRFSLAIDLDRDAVRVAVSDRSPELPRVLHPSGDREHGRGMAIVDGLASAWGTDQQPTHKVVWFELHLARSPAGGNRPTARTERAGEPEGDAASAQPRRQGGSRPAH